MNELVTMTQSVLWGSIADGLAVVASDGQIVAANGPFEELFGFDPGSAVDTSVDVLVPSKSVEEHAALREGFNATPAVRSMGASRLLEGRRQDGTLFPVNVSLSPATIDGASVVLVAVRDLSARVAVEAERSEAERRRITAEDHDRIARELHDTVIQHLFALGLRLQGLPALLDDDRTIDIVNESVDTIDSVIDQIRSSIHGLRKTTSEDRGVQEHVLAVIGEMVDVLPQAPATEFVGDFASPIDGAVLANIVPVLREALSNAGRHAQASTVTVTLEAEDMVTLTITDDGVGLPDRIERSGLSNLAARAHALGGTFAARNRDPHGTSVTWSVPRASSR